MAARRKVPVLTFKAAPVRVRVPATSANLGHGYDAFGLALDWFDDIIVQVLDEEAIEIDMFGEGADTLPRDGKHLIAKSMMAAFDAMGERPTGLVIRSLNTIPHGRGMGSSSAAIVGGIVAARALVVGGDQLLDNEAALKLASELEGHPDNVAAALLGGFTIAWGGAEDAHALRLTPHRDIRPIVCVPSTPVATKKARGLLPEEIAHDDAAFNVGRAALLVAALTEHPEFLLTATEDKLHQTQRSSAMKKSFELVQKLREAGHAAVISGAGPTVLVLSAGSVVEEVAEIAGDGFQTDLLKVSAQGAHVVPLEG
jgi:homoserine kinase